MCSWKRHTIHSNIHLHIKFYAIITKHAWMQIAIAIWKTIAFVLRDASKCETEKNLFDSLTDLHGKQSKRNEIESSKIDFHFTGVFREHEESIFQEINRTNIHDFILCAKTVFIEWMWKWMATSKNSYSNESLFD